MIDVVLLILKIAIVVLLYLFIWFVLRGAARDVLRGSDGSASAVAQPPDVVVPVAPSVPEPSLEERLARRAQRESERTMSGEVLDFSANIDPRLVVEQSPIVPAGVIFPLHGWVNVGRSPQSDIILDESFVSSTHARLVPRGQLYMVEDLGSTNGTFINEKQVTVPAPLRLDARLRIGETVFRYEE